MSAALVGAGLVAAGGVYAADRAADAQEEGADKAASTLQAQNRQARADTQLSRDSGNAAQMQLNRLMGIRSNPSTSQTPFTLDDFLNYNRRIDPKQGATGQMSDAQDQYRLYTTGRYGLDQNTIAQRFGFDPSLIAQAQQTETADQGSPDFGALTRGFTQTDLDNDVVNKNALTFALDQGKQGLDRQASASGSFLSGATQKALAKYTTGLMTQYGNDAFNRSNATKQQTFNMLSGTSGTGQVATNQVISSGQNMANGISANQTGVGNARGASAIATGNALSNAYSGYQNNQLMNSFMNQNSLGGRNDEMMRLNGQAMTGGR